MIPNATLILYTTPAEADANGGKTPGVDSPFPPGKVCAVCDPTAANLVSLANKVVGVTGMIYIELTSLAGMPVPSVGGRITYRMSNSDDPRVAEILNATTHVHAGLSHYALAVKQA